MSAKTHFDSTDTFYWTTIIRIYFIELQLPKYIFMNYSYPNTFPWTTIIQIHFLEIMHVF
jgi:hypothetical protein